MFWENATWRTPFAALSRVERGGVGWVRAAIYTLSPTPPPPVHSLLRPRGRLVRAPRTTSLIGPYECKTRTRHAKRSSGRYLNRSTAGRSSTTHTHNAHKTRCTRVRRTRHFSATKGEVELLQGVGGLVAVTTGLRRWERERERQGGREGVMKRARTYSCTTARIMYGRND